MTWHIVHPAIFIEWRLPYASLVGADIGTNDRDGSVALSLKLHEAKQMQRELDAAIKAFEKDYR